MGSRQPDQRLRPVQQGRSGQPIHVRPQQGGAACFVVGRGWVVDRVMVPGGQFGSCRVGYGRAEFGQPGEHGVDMGLRMVGAVRLGIPQPQAGQAAGDGDEHDAAG